MKLGLCLVTLGPSWNAYVLQIQRIIGRMQRRAAMLSTFPLEFWGIFQVYLADPT